MGLKIGENPISGQTPMLVIRRETETFRRWKKNFDFIWNKHSHEYIKDHKDEFVISSNEG